MAPTDPGAPANAPSVDELFARIRAGSDTEPAGAAASALRPRPRRPTRSTAGRGSGGAPEAPEALLGEEAAAPAGPDAEIIGRRDELLSPIAAKSEPHGEAHAGGRPEPHARPAAQHAEHRRRGAPRPRGRAPGDSSPTRCRSSWARRTPPGRCSAGTRRPGRPKGDAVDQAATGLARGGGGDAAPAHRRTGARSAGDERSARPSASGGASGWSAWSATSATHAFSAGVAAAAAHGADGKVRWVVTSTGGCSDCEDNALAGAVRLDRGVPHRPRLPAGALGLPLPGGAGGRLSGNSGDPPGPGRFGRVGGR